VIQTLLNVFDNGLMRLSSGNEVIEFKNTIIIMTSNLGARELYNFNWLQKTAMKRLITKFLEQLTVKLRKHNCQIQLKESAINFNQKMIKP
jgi:ATP-dependent Clp protease ATP-binding subunit ClpA